MKNYMIVFVSLLLSASLSAQDKGFSIVPKPEKKQVDIMYNGKLLTAYCYYDSIFKPFLFPVNTLDGITVTRGYPVAPVAGERTDHPHHIGIWMNYESVNGLDFWNNSTAIPGERRDHYGTIRHDQVIDTKTGKSSASLTVTANWQRPDGHILLKEVTTYQFSVKNDVFIVDRNSNLTATDLQVDFKDVKDGFLAIRVARELEMPSKEPGVFVDVHGNETKVPVDNNGVTGLYINDKGNRGDSVWSTKGRWTMLTGRKSGKDITVGIIDHPKNIGYPTYWHARGYGLFAANPLGRKVFSKGAEELNYSLKPGASVNLNYRVVIRSGKPTVAADMDKLADDFSRK